MTIPVIRNVRVAGVSEWRVAWPDRLKDHQHALLRSLFSRTPASFFPLEPEVMKMARISRHVGFDVSIDVKRICATLPEFLISFSEAASRPTPARSLYTAYSLSPSMLSLHPMIKHCPLCLQINVALGHPKFAQDG